MEKIIYIVALLLIGYAVYGTVQRVRGKAKSTCCGSSAPVKSKKITDRNENHYPFKYHLGIEGMSCSNCAARVENALNSDDDIWARVNLAEARAEVLSKTEKSEEALRILLNNMGYKVTGISKTT